MAQLPKEPQTCAACNVADWTVSITTPDNRKMHASCWRQVNGQGSVSVREEAAHQYSPSVRPASDPEWGRFSGIAIHPQAEEENYPYGFAVGGWPKTWTGKVVSKKDWANLSDWERHGSTGKVFCGLTKKWIEQETV